MRICACDTLMQTVENYLDEIKIILQWNKNELSREDNVKFFFKFPYFRAFLHFTTGNLITNPRITLYEQYRSQTRYTMHMKNCFKCAQMRDINACDGLIPRWLLSQILIRRVTNYHCFEAITPCGRDKCVTRPTTVVAPDFCDAIKIANWIRRPVLSVFTAFLGNARQIAHKMQQP